jgi:Protein of unknown function (DUF1161)
LRALEQGNLPFNFSDAFAPDIIVPSFSGAARRSPEDQYYTVHFRAHSFRGDGSHPPMLCYAPKQAPVPDEGDRIMKLLAAIGVVIFAAASAHAQGIKPCEDLKAEIAKKIEANGVKSYTLDIVEKDKDAEGKVVGTCDGGTKKIMYSKTSAAPKAPEPEASK